jgi:hypothetical protein
MSSDKTHGPTLLDRSLNKDDFYDNSLPFTISLYIFCLRTSASWYEHYYCNNWTKPLNFPAKNFDSQRGGASKSHRGG